METVDVLDESGQATGRVASIDEVCDHGLWHSTVHAVIITKDNKLVAQKRSKNIVFNPGLTEISAGGFVNTKESTEQAIVREIKEELGLVVKKSHLQYFGVQKWNHWHPSTLKHSKSFLHSYVIKIDELVLDRSPNNDETSKIFTLTLNEAKRLARLHRLKGFGRLTPSYRYWQKSVANAEKVIYPTVHFVCRANVFRSRLAQAYLRSKRKDLNIISSGVEASKNLNGRISWEAQYLLKAHRLKKYDSKNWQQTNQELIDSSDLVIFVASDVYEDAQKIVDLGGKKHRVWEITDILRATNLNNDEKRAEEIYKTITDGVDRLIEELC